MDKIFDRFRRKLMTEAFAKSFLIGVLIGASVDEAGLQERASTMIQFKGQESNILEMQRMDATKHIEEMDIKQLRCGVSLKILIAGIIVFALSIGCVFVPYNIMDILAAEGSTISEEEAQMMKELASGNR